MDFLGGIPLTTLLQPQTGVLLCVLLLVYNYSLILLYQHIISLSLVFITTVLVCYQSIILFTTVFTYLFLVFIFTVLDYYQSIISVFYTVFAY